MYTKASVYLFIAALLSNYTPSYGANPKKIYATATIAGALSGALVNAVQHLRKPRTTVFANIGSHIVGGSKEQKTLDETLTNIQDNQKAMAGQLATLNQHMHGDKPQLASLSKYGVLERIDSLEQELAKKASIKHVNEEIEPLKTVMEALLIYMQAQKDDAATIFNKTVASALPKSKD